jgi:hypothetical protein
MLLINNTLTPILTPKANPTEPAVRPAAPVFPNGAGAGAGESKSDRLSSGSGDRLPGDTPFGLSADVGDGDGDGDGDAGDLGTGEGEGGGEW